MNAIDALEYLKKNEENRAEYWAWIYWWDEKDEKVYYICDDCECGCEGTYIEQEFLEEHKNKVFKRG